MFVELCNQEVQLFLYGLGRALEGMRGWTVAGEVLLITTVMGPPNLTHLVGEKEWWLFTCVPPPALHRRRLTTPSLGR